MGQVVEMNVDRINTVLPPGVTVDWRKYQRARKAFFDCHPSRDEYEQLKREYHLEAMNMASWMDVIMEQETGE